MWRHVSVPCWRSGCCWADGRDGRGRGAARARPASRDGRARSRAATPKAEAAEGRDLEVKDVRDVKVGKGLNKAELRIAGARAIPRPEVRDEGIGEKAGSMGTRNWPNLPPESYQHMEVLHPTLLQARRPSKLERLSSAKRDAKNGQPVSCRESKDSKGRVTPAMERLAPCDVVAFQGTHGKHHRLEDAKAHPQNYSRTQRLGSCSKQKAKRAKEPN